jgi:hypothetical protein
MKGAWIFLTKLNGKSAPGEEPESTEQSGWGILTDEGKMVSPKSIQDFTGI